MVTPISFVGDEYGSFLSLEIIHLIEQSEVLFGTKDENGKDTTNADLEIDDDIMDEDDGEEDFQWDGRDEDDGAADNGGGDDY